MTDLIRELPRDERPRERMMMHGAATLSDAELVAILLGSGRRGKNAIQVGRELLTGGMAGLSRQQLKDIVSISGIGPAKATRVAAVIEIARRMREGIPEDPPPFEHTTFGPKLVSKYGGAVQERLGAAFLDARHCILKQREIFVGTINHALVSTGDILRFALLDCATAVVVYHNHPSGNCTPSHEDEMFTTKLKQSLDLVDVQLVDHLIIGLHSYFSMKEKGLI